MSLTITAKNFFGLRDVSWTLPGAAVCALVGPNGAGKTTLLKLPMFLRATMESGIGSAAVTVGGPAYMRHFDAPSEEHVELGVKVGDLDWWMRLIPTPKDIECDDRILHKGAVLLSREPFAPVTSVNGSEPLRFSGGPSLRAAYAMRPREFDLLEPLVRALQSCQVYEEQNYQIQYLRSTSNGNLSDSMLSVQGTNAFHVLRNWRDARATRPRWDFVIDGLQQMFPDLFEDIEFASANNQLAASFVRPGRSPSVPHYLAPNGWLVGLLHLCAVASTEPGGVVAIDEPENALHPFAIRTMMDAMNEWALAHKITVILATHSPVIINQFAGAPERLFVMQPGESPLPVALDELRDRQWLKSFALGDLFMHDEFGAPVVP